MITRLALSLGLLLPMAADAQWVDIPDPAVLGFGETNRFYFIDDQIGYGAINGCRIARTADGGQTWTLVGDHDPGDANGILYAIDFDAAGIYGVAIGQSGFSTDLIGMVSHDGGLTWEDAPDITGINSVSVRLEVLGTDTFLVNTSLTSWALTTNGGQSFTPDYLTSAPYIQFLDAQHGFVLGASVLHELDYTNDGGQTWVQHDLPGLLVLYTPFSFADTLRGIVVQDAPDAPDMLLRTTDGGSTWDTVLFSPTATLNMAYTSLSAEGNGLVAIQNDDTLHIWLTDDFGATWTEHTPAETDIVGAQATTGGVFYVMGDGGPYNYWRYSGAVDQVLEQSAQPSFTYDSNTSTLHLREAGPWYLRVFDTCGRQMLNTHAPGNSSFTLRLNPGLYVVQVEAKGAVISERVYVQ